MNHFPIITTLAEYQTRFWVQVGLEMQRNGDRALFLSFDSRSNDLLSAAGLEYVDATASTAAALLGNRDPADVVRGFGVERPHLWLAHEKFAFGVRESDRLLRKLAGALLCANQAIDIASQHAEPAAMVQELGGFLSVVGSHFAALHRELPSWMIEPSFFRGRLLFLHNSMAAMRLPPDLAGPITKPIRAYLDDTLQRSAIVIPQKDSHQYTTAFRKIVNRRNLHRLGEKLIDKHVLRKEQEFAHIGAHVSQHARMLLNSRRLAPRYTPLPDCGPFVYYPLHVPGDMALTVRSPEYLDQLALIDYLCRIVPLGYKVAIKEHPAMIGAVAADRLIALLERYDNLALIHPQTNNFEVLGAARAIVSVNSKSGAEAGLLGRPVVVLGDAFYRQAPFACPVSGLSELEGAIGAVLSGQLIPPGRAAIERYFAGLWPMTCPGELYVAEAENVQTFTGSLTEALR